MEKIDRGISEKKIEQNNSDYVYCLVYLDENREMIRECYSDRKKAEERFIELMSSLFYMEEDIKSWENIQSYDNGDTRFEKDHWEFRRSRLGDAPEILDKYPYNTWSCISTQGYQELYLEKIKLNIKRYDLPSKI